MNILNLDNPILCRAFNAHSCETFSVGYNSNCNLVVSRPLSALKIYNRLRDNGFTPDLVFYCDSGNIPYFTDVEKLPCPTFFYSIDTYCNHWHFLFANAFDLVFVAQKSHVPIMPEGGARAKWLPLFAMEGKDADRGEERDIPISFVGTLNPKNIPDREPFLRAFAKLQPIFIASGEYIGIFNRSRIVLNNTAASEVNFRCFETMACGAALLTEASPHGLDELFNTGEHILPCYKRLDAQSAASIACKALEEPKRLKEMAQRGRDLVLSKHLDTHRAAAVIAEARAAGIDRALKQRLDESDRLKEHMRAVYTMIYADLNNPALARYKEYYRRLSEK